MRFEQQRIEAAPQTPHVENITSSPPPSYKEANNGVNASPPPSYEEASNGVNAAQAHDGTSDAMGYFLGEVSEL